VRPILICRDKCAVFLHCRMINRVVISLIVTQKAALICFDDGTRVVISLIVTQKAALICFDDGTLIEMYRLLLFTCYLGV